MQKGGASQGARQIKGVQMKMISYWRSATGEDVCPFFVNGDLSFIYGFYDHKNAGNAERCLGMYWNGRFPFVKNEEGMCVLAPFTVQTKEAISIVRGLRNDVECGIYGESDKQEMLSRINAALDFFLEA